MSCRAEVLMAAAARDALRVIARESNSANNKLTDTQIRNSRSRLNDLCKSLVSKDEMVLSCRRSTKDKAA